MPAMACFTFLYELVCNKSQFPITFMCTFVLRLSQTNYYSAQQDGFTSIHFFSWTSASMLETSTYSANSTAMLTPKYSQNTTRARYGQRSKTEHIVLIYSLVGISNNSTVLSKPQYTGARYGETRKPERIVLILKQLQCWNVQHLACHLYNQNIQENVTLVMERSEKQRIILFISLVGISNIKPVILPTAAPLEKTELNCVTVLMSDL